MKHISNEYVKMTTMSLQFQRALIHHIYIAYTNVIKPTYRIYIISAKTTAKRKRHRDENLFFLMLDSQTCMSVGMLAYGGVFNQFKWFLISVVAYM